MSAHRLFIGAYNTNDFGDDPVFVRIDDGAALLPVVERLASICAREALFLIEVEHQPVQWGYAGWQDDLNLRGFGLVVTADSFWFKCHPKHSSDVLETRGVSIRRLAETLAGDSGDPVFLEIDDIDLEETIRDDGEAAESSDAAR